MAATGEVDAVVFDWGGTLTPWHDVDLGEQWRVFAREIHGHRLGDADVDPADLEHAQALADTILAAESKAWARGRHEHRLTRTPIGRRRHTVGVGGQKGLDQAHDLLDIPSGGHGIAKRGPHDQAVVGDAPLLRIGEQAAGRGVGGEVVRVEGLQAMLDATAAWLRAQAAAFS